MKTLPELCRDALDLILREQALLDRIADMSADDVLRLLHIEAAARTMVETRGRAWTGAAPWYAFGESMERLAGQLHAHKPLDLAPAALARVLHGEADAAE